MDTPVIQTSVNSLFSTYIFSADITPEMLKLCSFTWVKVFFLVLIYVFNFDLFEFSAAILEKGLFVLNNRNENPIRSTVCRLQVSYTRIKSYPADQLNMQYTYSLHTKENEVLKAATPLSLANPPSRISNGVYLNLQTYSHFTELKNILVSNQTTAFLNYFPTRS